MALIKNPLVIPSTPAHCAYLAQNLREIDKREVWASSCFLPSDALEYSLHHCPECYTVVNPENKKPILMFGVARYQSVMNNKRAIWMLATDEINNISMRFLRECDFYITLLGTGSVIYNYVLEGNDTTLKWLHWLGFTILKPKPYGAIGKNFHYVEKDLSCVTQLQQQSQ